MITNISWDNQYVILLLNYCSVKNKNISDGCLRLGRVCSLNGISGYINSNL